MKRYWIAIDWGTTNFRAFLMDNQHVIDRTARSCGLLSIDNHAFASTLQQNLSSWLKDHGPLPIMMAGMVGSRQGWHEVPYAPLPCDISNLISKTFAFDTPWGSPAWIVPGVNGTSQYGQPDVMRGEEVQLLGLNTLHPANEIFALLPGTHSKHAQIVDGKITAFSTFMSGELFSLLSQHSILGRALPQQEEDPQTFLLGVETASRGTAFSHLIFSARTRRLTGEIPDAHVHSYLSGLVMGYELLALPPGLRAWLVGSPALTTRYELAARQRGLDLAPVDGDDCFIRGLSHLFTAIQGKLS